MLFVTNANSEKIPLDTGAEDRGNGWEKNVLGEWEGLPHSNAFALRTNDFDYEIKRRYLLPD